MHVVWNKESYQTATSPAHAQKIQQIHKKLRSVGPNPGYVPTNTIHPRNCPRQQQEYKQLSAMFPQSFTPSIKDVQGPKILSLRFLMTKQK